MKANSLKQTAPENSVNQLMSAVILQAFEDLKSKDYRLALDAMVFLTGEDFPLWAEACGLPFAEFQIGMVPEAWKLLRYRNRYRAGRNRNG